MNINLTELCQEYIINIYETTHAKGNNAIGLAMQRADIHNLILNKLKVEREDGILQITDNLDWINFDINKDYTREQLKMFGNKLRSSLEIYSAKRYPNQTLIECNTDKLDNFTKCNTYLEIASYDDYVIIQDDNDEEYEIDKELQLDLEDMNVGDFSYCYIGNIG